MDSSQIDTLRLINNISIFSGIGIPEQHMLANRCTIIKCDEDVIMIEQGEKGDRLYGIIKGKVLISRRAQSKGWMQINVLTSGDVFGEIAILRHIPRTTRVTTLTPCIFLTISAQDFLDIYQYFPPNSRDNIQLIIAKRLAQLHE